MEQPTIAIVGAGLIGTSLNYYLMKDGFKSDIYEKDQIGGVYRSFKFQLKDEYLESVPFSFQSSDANFCDLLSSLKLSNKIISNITSTAIYIDKLYAIARKRDIAAINPLNILDRMKLYQNIKKPQNNPVQGTISCQFEQMYGKTTFEVIIKPILTRYFQENYRNVEFQYAKSIIDRIITPNIKLNYIKYGLYKVFDRLEKEVLKYNSLYFREKVKRVQWSRKHRKYRIRTDNEGRLYDIIVFTNRSYIDQFPRLRLELSKRKILPKVMEYNPATILCCKFRKQLSENYRIEVLSEQPIDQIIEHTNLVDQKYYEGSIIYLIKYGIDSETPEQAKKMLNSLKKIIPYSDLDLLHTKIFSFPKMIPITKKASLITNTLFRGIFQLNSNLVFPDVLSVDSKVTLSKQFSSTLTH
ncbi:NAD(P)-binding protein [Candidatus Woesearchaeota archaeon]|nr:NAD(P)-binding protein [Candidatus Woesearchaeota archaeon]